MMDCEEDDRDPWEREEEEAVAMCEAQAVAEMEAFGMCEEPPPIPHEPTAVPGEESGSPVQLPLSAPVPPEPHSPPSAASDSSEVGVVQERSRGSESSTTSAGSSDASPSESPQPRLRLREKTTAPSAEEAGLSVNLPAGYKEEFISKGVWAGMVDRARYNYAYEKIRSFYIWKLHGGRLQTAEEREAWKKKTSWEKQKEGRQAFKDLSADVRNVYVRKWLDVARPPYWLKQSLEARLLSGNDKGKGLKVKTQGVLVTWNLPDEGASDSARLSQSLPPEQRTLDALVARLRSEPAAKSLWGRVVDHGQVCKQLSGADDVAITLEVCPETYELQRRLRLHIHCFLKSSKQPLSMQHMQMYEFEGNSCHQSTQIGGLACTKGRSSWSGFFYCCLREKRGTVFSEATKAPFSKFLVNPAWIMSLVQAGKLECSVARELLVKCVNASRHVKELEQHDMELEKEAVRVAMGAAQRLLGKTLKQQKFYDKAAAFARQFEEAQHRYKFLVLSGPSQVGKTAFARSLVEPGMGVLEVNCASGEEPNLRAYRLRLHDLILFDEIVAKQVADQRKLFQAQSAPVQLGCSATNCHSYDVFVWRKKLVLASNNWHTTLATLSPGDQEWIHANSIVLDVEEAMWIC